jgi:hypothetical protein
MDEAHLVKVMNTQGNLNKKQVGPNLSFFSASDSLNRFFGANNICGPLVYFPANSQTVLRIRDVLSRIRIRPLLHPGSGSEGGKKAPDPGSDLFLYKGY